MMITKHYKAKIDIINKVGNYIQSFNPKYDEKHGYFPPFKALLSTLGEKTSDIKNAVDQISKALGKRLFKDNEHDI